MERKIGGRFYERTPDGIEHQWGEVTAWEPPHHLAYNWYLGSDPQRPTKVDIRFIAEGQSLTRLEIEHRGPELIGDLWWERYSGYEAAWEDVLPCFGAACHSQEI